MVWFQVEEVEMVRFSECTVKMNGESLDEGVWEMIVDCLCGSMCYLKMLGE